MDTQTIQVGLQVLSSVVVTTGVTFAALQLRHWRRAGQMSNFIKLVEMQMALRMARVQNPRLAAVFQHDVEDLKNDEDIQLYFLNLVQLSVFEVAWYGFRTGQIGEDYFRSWENRMRALRDEPSFRKMLSKPSMKILHEEFERYVKELMKP